MAQDMIIPVILCGGSGTRLWPMSRESRPKQFLSLTGDESLLQMTLSRAAKITGGHPERIVVVTLEQFAHDITEQMNASLQGSAQHVIREPLARNTAAAISYAAHYVRDQFGPEAVMWVLPSDHHIGRPEDLAAALASAVESAKGGHLVTFGIKPTRPDTGYGYIRLPGKMIMNNISVAAGFFEKPDLKTAETYLKSGDYLWNSGMFVFTARAVLEEFLIYAPDLQKSVEQAAGEKPLSPDAQAYAQIPQISFDKAIMEKSSRVMVVPCDPDWSDIGSWQSLWDIAAKDQDANVIRGQVAQTGTSGCFIQGGKRLIAAAGVENLVIIDTGDAILVADRSNTEALRAMVAKLKAEGRDDLLQGFTE